MTYTEANYENAVIEVFRDTLLPRLMSGELSVADLDNSP
jgi:hypothetical protein